MTDQQRLDLGWLEAWIERGLIDDRPFPRAALSEHYRQQALFAERAGFLVRTGFASEITCPHCDDPHGAPVRKSQEEGFESFCIFHRWTQVSDDEVTLVALDRARMIARLAEAAGGQAKRWLASGRLCVLSELNTSSGKRTWTLAYADGLGDANVLSGVIEELKSFKPGGLLVTTSEVSVALPLPKEFRIIRLRDLFHGLESRFSLDMEVALGRLGVHTIAPGKAGRSSPIDTEKRLWLELRRDPDWPERYTEQAERILARWPDDGPKANKPATIADHIGKHGVSWLKEGVRGSDNSD